MTGVVRACLVAATGLSCCLAPSTGLTQAAANFPIETVQKFRVAQSTQEGDDTRMYLVGVLAGQTTSFPAGTPVTRITVPRSKPAAIKRDGYNQLEFTSLFNDTEVLRPGKGLTFKILYLEADARNISVLLLADRTTAMGMIPNALKPRTKVEEISLAQIHRFTCAEFVEATVNIALGNYALVSSIAMAPRWTGSVAFSASDTSRLVAFVEQLQVKPEATGKATISSAGLLLEAPLKPDRSAAIQHLESLCTSAQAQGLIAVDFGLKFSQTFIPRNSRP